MGCGIARCPLEKFLSISYYRHLSRNFIHLGCGGHWVLFVVFYLAAQCNGLNSTILVASFRFYC